MTKTLSAAIETDNCIDCLKPLLAELWSLAVVTGVQGHFPQLNIYLSNGQLNYRYYMILKGML